MTNKLPSPVVYFGGKASQADKIWQALGDVPLYLEPFLGSAAVWLARPRVDPARHLERLNDKFGFIPNFWRAVKADPEAVAHWADQPNFECDLHARHIWLVGQAAGMVERLEGDPTWYDVKIAGWWVWSMANWIGGGFCSGEGPWQSIDGRLVKVADAEGRGISRRLPHMGNSGQGINRQGISRRRPHMGPGVGVNRNRRADLRGYFEALAARAHAGVVVACGDYTRLLDKPAVNRGLNGNNPTLTGVVLDPPYSHAEREKNTYAVDEDIDADVRAWCLRNGDNPYQRIAYCTYEDGDTRLQEAGWLAHRWKAQGGMGNHGDGRGRANKAREVIWFSPHCLIHAKPQQRALFD